ncbi:unnamed protein product, partial [Nesidiocoris tenuis]
MVRLLTLLLLNLPTTDLGLALFAWNPFPKAQWLETHNNLFSPSESAALLGALRRIMIYERTSSSIEDQNWRQVHALHGPIQDISCIFLALSIRPLQAWKAIYYLQKLSHLILTVKCPVRIVGNALGRKWLAGFGVVGLGLWIRFKHDYAILLTNPTYPPDGVHAHGSRGAHALRSAGRLHFSAQAEQELASFAATTCVRSLDVVQSHKEPFERQAGTYKNVESQWTVGGYSISKKIQINENTRIREIIVNMNFSWDLRFELWQGEDLKNFISTNFGLFPRHVSLNAVSESIMYFSRPQVLLVGRTTALFTLPMVGLLAFIYMNQVENDLHRNLNSTFVENYGISARETDAIDQMQQEYKCCGASGFENYNESRWREETNTTNLVPDSCCKSVSPGCGRSYHPSNIPYTDFVWTIPTVYK